MISEYGPILWEFQMPTNLPSSQTADGNVIIRETGRLVTILKKSHNVQTNLPVPAALSLQRIFYFEVTIVTLHVTFAIIGIAPKV